MVVVYAELSEYHVFPLLFRRRPSAVVSKRATRFLLLIFKSGGFLTRQARLLLAYSTESVVEKSVLIAGIDTVETLGSSSILGAFSHCLLLLRNSFFPSPEIVTVSVVRSVVLVLENQTIYLIYGMMKQNTSIPRMNICR